MSYFQNLYKVDGKPPLVLTDATATTYITGYDISANCAQSDLSYTLFNASTGGAYQYNGIDALVYADCRADCSNVITSVYSTQIDGSFCRIVAIAGGGGGGGGRHNSNHPSDGDGAAGGGGGGSVVSPVIELGPSSELFFFIGAAGVGNGKTSNDHNNPAGTGGETRVQVIDKNGIPWECRAYGGTGGENGTETGHGHTAYGGTGGGGAFGYLDGSSNFHPETADAIIFGGTGKNGGTGGVGSGDRSGGLGATTADASGSIGNVSGVWFTDLCFSTTYSNGGNGGKSYKANGNGGTDASAGTDGQQGEAYIIWYVADPSGIVSRSSL